MEEFVTEFVNLQHYVPYLRVEKIKVYNFIGCLPLVYKKKIVFEIPKQWMEQLERPSCATICLNKYPHLLEKEQEVILIKITAGEVQPIAMG